MHTHQPRFSIITRALLPALAVLLCLAQAASAATMRLSRSLAQDGEVVEYKIDSTGTYAVYKTSKLVNSSTVPAIYSVQTSGGAPVSLSSVLPSGDVGFTLFNITGDGKRVIYLANQYSADYRSLYTIPVAGGARVRLSPVGQNVTQFALSPDGQWVVFYSTDNGVYPFKYHLYKAPTGAASPASTQEFMLGATTLWLDNFKFTPDSTRLVFLGMLTATSDWGVYSLPVASMNGPAILLTPTMLNNWILDYLVTPDSKHVVYEYIADEPGIDQRVYMSPIDGPASASVNLGGPMIAGGGVQALKLTPDGSRVVFVADKDVAGKDELYSMALSWRGIKPPPVKLNVPLPGTQDVAWNTFAISPDSKHVVYEANQNNQHDLFSVPINGPLESNVPLSQPKNPTGPLTWTNFITFSPDGTRVIYTAMQDTPNFVELYSAPVDGPLSAAVKLNVPIVDDGSGYGTILTALASSDGQSVFYAANTGGSRRNLYQVPLAGPASASRNLTSFPADNTAASGVKQVSGSQKVTFLQNTTGLGNELFVTDSFGKLFLPLVRKQ